MEKADRIRADGSSTGIYGKISKVHFIRKMGFVDMLDTFFLSRKGNYIRKYTYWFYLNFQEAW